MHGRPSHPNRASIAFSEQAGSPLAAGGWVATLSLPNGSTHSTQPCPTIDLAMKSAEEYLAENHKEYHL